MLRGFLGFSPIAKGCRIEPRLPASFPSLTIEGIRIQGLTLSVTASADAVVVRKRSGTAYSPFVIEAPGYRPIPPVDWSTTNEITLTR
jgi:hypothetical protein